MNRRHLLMAIGLAVLAIAIDTCRAMPALPDTGSRTVKKPNVLLIIIDDMNDGISLFGKNRPFKTPHIETLAQRGVFFSRAYCASAACNPSRAATLTGLRPHRTGIYGNNTDWRRATKGHLTLPEYFGRHGYFTAGFGKIYHHQKNGAFNDPAAWDMFKKMDAQYMPQEKLNHAQEYGSRNTDWGPWPRDDQESKTIDFKSVGYAIEALKQQPKSSQSKPFFLACGIFKPHSPFFAPPTYHRRYDDSLDLPLRRGDDWDDLPSGAAKLMGPKQWFWKGMLGLERRKPGSYRNFIHAYAACCSFADTSVGRLLKALDESGQAQNTIVVLWSDHGFHLGEKDHIEKFSLWEKANHIPFVVVDPRRKDSAGKICEQPIDMTAIFPTLIELCGLPTYDALHGRSAVDLISRPETMWKQPALMTYGERNHAVRSERWRYIRYVDGTEELYDHESDPHEWTNLVGNPSYAGIIAEHKKWIPTENTPAKDALKKY
jgi:arylsulfatase A-like enzyme